MKILYHHRTRAADAQGVHIEEMMAAFRGLGHEVEMAALVQGGGEKSGPEVKAGVPLWKRLVEKLPFLFEAIHVGYNIVGFWMVARHVRRFRPDFIYERYSLLNFSGVLAAKWYGVPLVLEVNSPLAFEMKEEGLLRLERFGSWSEKAICNGAAVVVTVTSVLKRMLVEGGVEEGRVQVMANGVDPAKFRVGEGDEGLRRRLGLEGRRVIGFVGWFRPWHGLEMLVEAFEKSGLAEEGVSVLLVGDGPALPSLREAVAERGLEGRVVITGAVRHGEIPEYVALFDCAVQPAANQYCCPMKIIEYLAVGKPVIAPAQENIEELVGEGVDAALFEAGSMESLSGALRRVMGDEQEMARLQAGARTAVERRGYLWRRNAERVVEMVRSAVR